MSKWKVVCDDGTEVSEHASWQDAVAEAQRLNAESGEPVCVEADGCPTEMAVLKRFWREHQRTVRCTHCDGQCGSVETYRNQACMPIKGKVQCIDWCIHHIVAALNAGGVDTVASCCGHGKQEGRIDLADGRVLRITTRGDEP